MPCMHHPFIAIIAMVEFQVLINVKIPFYWYQIYTTIHSWDVNFAKSTFLFYGIIITYALQF